MLCYSSQMNSSVPPMGRQDRDHSGKACRPNGKEMGKEGVLSNVVPELFILPSLAA